MTEQDRKRLSLIRGYEDGKYTQAEVTEILGLSTRQIRRIISRYKNYGDQGIIHKARGKPSNHTSNQQFKDRVIERYQQRYHGFGPSFAAEKLAEDGLVINAETLRLWLKESGLWVQARKRKLLRKRRARRERFGELLQLDGSIHDWFGIGQKYCLMNLIDDATGEVMSFMDSGETTYAALVVLEKWVRRYGVPKAIYVDLKTVYVSPQTYRRSAQVEQTAAFTHFSRACDKLGIQIIKAYSPQAKGRVERVHRVFQDRFIKELYLRGISHIDAANKFLDQEFLDKLNKKFAVAAASNEDAHRDYKIFGDIENIFCWEYKRRLDNTACIKFNRQIMEIRQEGVVLCSRDIITIREHLNGKISLWRKDQQLKYREIEQKPILAKEKEVKLKKKSSWKPGLDHPWKRDNIFAKDKRKVPTELVPRFAPLTLQSSASQPVL